MGTDATIRQQFFDYNAIGKVTKGYDGNMYFLKNTSRTIFVIPNPNGPMPVNLIPHEVDLSTPSHPNIVGFEGFVGTAPEQIDGGVYLTNDYTKVSLKVSSDRCDGNCKDIKFSLKDENDNSVFLNHTLTNCQDELTFCVLNDRTYTLITEDGLRYENVIVNGQIFYLSGESSYNLQKNYFECCPALEGITHGDVTIIDDTNSTIATNTIWDGKVFIKPGVILYVNGANLDITNVDVVLGQCASIYVVNGGTVQAHNSVFRPCDDNQNWDRLMVVASKGNVFEECLFKNATRGLSFQGPVEAKITSNTFKDCYYGMEFVYSQGFHEGIASNVFVKTKTPPTDLSCDYKTQGSTQMYAIDATINGEIEHNEFSTNSPTYETAVKIENSSVSLLNNSISGYGNAIRIRKGNDIEISMNEVTLRQGYYYGVYINEATSVKLTENLFEGESFEASNEGYQGVYMQRVSDALIKGNQLIGLRRGISLQWSNNYQVIQNQFEDIDEVAIYSVMSQSANIACNEINMHRFGGTGTNQGIGIYYYSNIGGNPNISVVSNCILNTSTPMYLYSYDNATLPIIRNNYLYNYTNSGIYNNGFQGNIGTGSVSGQNTFYSNYSSAIDINSTTPITAANNFGASSLNNVSITQNNSYYSTASCANTVFEVDNQNNLDISIPCDNPAVYTWNTLPTPSEGNRTSFEMEITYEKADALIEMDNIYITANPNPISDILTLSWNVTNSEQERFVKIMDLKGKVIDTKELHFTQGRSDINVSNLEAGIYLIALDGSSAVKPVKIVKY